MTLSTLNRMSVKQYKKLPKLNRAKLLKKLQIWFNTFIRLRDKDKGCISCGGLVTQAGHYRSVGSHPELRFDESNTNGQDARCNLFLSGNLIEYRLGLVKRVGEQEVNRLETQRHRSKLSNHEIQNLIEVYKSKVRELENSEIVGLMSEVG